MVKINIAVSNEQDEKALKHITGEIRCMCKRIKRYTKKEYCAEVRDSNEKVILQIKSRNYDRLNDVKNYSESSTASTPS